ncbi:hypothetical protein OAH37_01180 [Acidimicrobiia bacterium]|nr:hypothetical protein [Acidimicrobiia bacterium]
MINDEDFNLIPINPTIENIIQKLKKIDIIDRNIFTIVSQESIEHIKKMEIKNKKFVTSFNGFWQDKFFCR